MKGNDWLYRFWDGDKNNLVKFLIGANLIGAAYGFYYYVEQLSETPMLLWLFTWDCPFYSLLFAAWLFWWRKNNYKVSGSLLQTISLLFVATGLIKYGFWTELIVTDAWRNGYPIQFVQVYFVATHFIMILEGLFLLTYVLSDMYNDKVWPISGLIVWVWMVGNDAADYIWDAHPWLYYPWQYELAKHTASTFTILFALFAVGYFLLRMRRQAEVLYEKKEVS